MKVLVVKGGRSVEREISIESAGFVVNALESAGHGTVEALIACDGSWTVEGRGVLLDSSTGRWRLLRDGSEVLFDIVFPVLHGTFGEDGTIQGLCEMASWRYAGADVMASAVGMNKIVFKRLASGAGIPVVPWMEVSRCLSTPASAEVVDRLGLPLFVKPARLGSSVGISRVDGLGELSRAVEAAFGYDELVLVEKAVIDPREIEVSVLGTGKGVRSSVPGEVVPGREWYDFEAKYSCERSRLVIPADIEPEMVMAARSFAEQAMGLLGGRGFARVDFLLGRDGIFLNEINTIPGFTAISMFPKLWAASGLDAGSLMDAILDEAASRPSAGLWKEQPLEPVQSRPQE